MKREWLINIRGDRTQLEIANVVDLSRSAYVNIELGNRSPSVEVAKKIANELKFDWTKFF